MEYGDFYDIAAYGNVAWRGKLTQKEIACNAFNYWCEFQTSNKMGQVTHTMKELFYLLRQDGSEEAVDFLETIQRHANF